MFRPTPPALSLQVKMVRRWGMRANASDLEIELTEPEKALVSQIDFNFSATSHDANSWRPMADAMEEVMRANASDLEIELTEPEKALVSQIDFNFSATSHDANSWRPMADAMEEVMRI